MVMTSKRVTQMIDIPKGLKETIQSWTPAGITAIFLIIVLVWMWQTPARKHLPEELWGEWRTTDPSYADRTFEFDNVCINFTTGEGTISVGFIKDVKEIPEGNRTLYNVSYIVDDTPNEVSFYYEPNSGLWFKNQEKVVWRKTQDN
jgi:hypothetical protein